MSTDSRPMIARVEFPWDERDKFKKIMEDPAKAHLLAGVLGEDAMPGSDRPYHSWPSETVIDMATDGVVLLGLGINFKVLNFKGCMNLKGLVPEGMAGGSVDVIIQVPNFGLLAIDEVEVMEDACTYQLQKRLDEGWRIVAVCPPNAVRRPDYIIGRSKGGIK